MGAGMSAHGFNGGHAGKQVPHERFRLASPRARKLHPLEIAVGEVQAHRQGAVEIQRLRPAVLEIRAPRYDVVRRENRIRKRQLRAREGVAEQQFQRVRLRIAFDVRVRQSGQIGLSGGDTVARIAEIADCAPVLLYDFKGGLSVVGRAETGVFLTGELQGKIGFFMQGP